MSPTVLTVETSTNYFSLLKRLTWYGLRTAREHKVKTAVLLFGLYLTKKMFGLYKAIKNVYSGGDDLKMDLGEIAEESKETESEQL